MKWFSLWFSSSSFHNHFSGRIFGRASLYIFQHFCTVHTPMPKLASAPANHFDTAQNESDLRPAHFCDGCLTCYVRACYCVSACCSCVFAVLCCVFPVSLLCLSACCSVPVHVNQCHPPVGSPCHSLAPPPPDSPLYYYFFCIPPPPPLLLLILLLLCLSSLHCMRARSRKSLAEKSSLY